jgi:hypothetical protein
VVKKFIEFLSEHAEKRYVLSDYHLYLYFSHQGETPLYFVQKGYGFSMKAQTEAVFYSQGK